MSLAAPIPHDEPARLAALKSMAILDTPAEPAFDRIPRLAARSFDAPIALVSLIDRDRQWFKARHGLDVEETPREVAFCGWTILGDQPLVVPNATLDVRFATNPLVRGFPNIRFYAGAPLLVRGGHRLGTLCVIDDKPRELLDDEELMALEDYASLVVAAMEKRLQPTPTPAPPRPHVPEIDLGMVESARRLAMLTDILGREMDGRDGLRWILEPLNRDARALHGELRRRWEAVQSATR